jgi:hypothetical protein
VGPTDHFLDDFLLTHIVFMPLPILIDELATHYHCDTELQDGEQSPDDPEYYLACKRRVVQFIQRWVLTVRNAVFDDRLITDFIQVRSHLPVPFAANRFSCWANKLISGLMPVSFSTILPGWFSV